MSEVREFADVSLEGALVMLICVIAVKIYKMRCDTSSKCFNPNGENGVMVETHGEEQV